MLPSKGLWVRFPAKSVFKMQVPVTGNCKQMLLCCIEPVCKEKNEEAKYHHLLLQHWTFHFHMNLVLLQLMQFH
jgi:hypothetical protein